MFGGLADKIEDKKKCSLDDWGYFHFSKDASDDFSAESDWIISESTEGDLKDLECLYENISGGLMLQSLNISDGYSNNKTLLKDYQVSGFSREIELYSVKKDTNTCAIIMIDRSDAGLNMSELTNSFKIFIINGKELTRKTLDGALKQLSNHYEEEKIPVLIYPGNQAAEMEIPIEKIYTMWVLNMEATDSYFHHLKKLLRNIRH